MEGGMQKGCQDNLCPFTALAPSNSLFLGARLGFYSRPSLLVCDLQVRFYNFLHLFGD